MESTTKTCKRCKRLFEYYGFGHYYCPECAKLDAAIFDKVRDFLYNNGVHNMQEISDGTGVSVEQIETYLREGRLEIPANCDAFIRCESCGTKMRSGRYCPTCAAKIKANWNGNGFWGQDEIGEPIGNAKVMMNLHRMSPSSRK